MSKKKRPSLKDYLRTGKVQMEPEESPSRPKDAEDEAPASPGKPQGDAFLKVLTPRDLEVWEPILRAGIEIKELPLDYASLRKAFRVTDKVRFTYYILEREAMPLRSIRTSAEIREPLLLVIGWDEMGTLTLYWPQL